MAAQTRTSQDRRTGLARASGRALRVALTLLWSVTAAAQSTVYLSDGSELTGASPAPQKSLPVLFVHGHKPAVSNDPDPNYVINWQKPLGTLPSFEQALALTQNDTALDLEPYYIHFDDQGRSILEDAADIADAVERILARHDSGHTPGMPSPTTAVRVAIIAYSKGTISSRLYLKSLHLPLAGLPSPRAGFNPISEFVAISPPNHGLALADSFTLFNAALRELNNGYKQDCGQFLLPSLRDQEDFIADLNGHPIGDSQAAPPGAYPDEAPGSRPNGTPVWDGTLYVTLVADGGRDFVGGSQPSADCQGRVLAMNLAPDAEHREFSSIAAGEVDTGLNDSTVHQETVHTPSVMCVALYTVVHHRVPEAQDPAQANDGDAFACELSNGVPVVPPRTALVQVLDLSGSMLTAACGTCNPKLQVLQESVQIFVDLWGLVSGPADQMGVQLFGNEIRPLDPAAPPLLPITATSAQAITTQVAALSTVPGQLTAMGGGLQQAIGILQQNAGIPERHVLLFSDGMQNVNPMVEPSAGSLRIIDMPGRPSSNVTALEIPVDLGDLGGIKVHTIGVGATEPFMLRLAEIADATDGTRYPTLAPDESLRQHFIESLIEALRGNSPQLVDYRRAVLKDDGGTESFVVGKGARRVALKLSWHKGNDLRFTVHRNGVDVTGAGRLVDRDFYRLFVADRSPWVAGEATDFAGEWQIRISGRKGTAYEAAAIVDEPALDYRASLAIPIVATGEPLELRLRLSSAGRAITTADTVQAVVHRPGNSLANLLAGTPTASEPSRAQVEGAGAARTRLQELLEQEATRTALAPVAHSLTLDHVGNGEYAASFSATEIPGPYGISVQMAGDDPLLGAYRRRTTLTALVRAGAPVSNTSDLALKPVASADGVRELRLTLVPRDRFGNHVGPDYGDRLQVTVDGKPTRSAVTDRLDGSYVVDIATAGQADPRIGVSALGVTLYDGPASAITEPDPPSSLVPWLVLAALLVLLIVVLIARRIARP